MASLLVEAVRLLVDLGKEVVVYVRDNRKTNPPPPAPPSTFAEHASNTSTDFGQTPGEPTITTRIVEYNRNHSVEVTAALGDYRYVATEMVMDATPASTNASIARLRARAIARVRDHHTP